MTRFTIDGVSQGLSRDRRRAAANWITTNPARLRSMQEQFASTAPKRHRQAGWANDLANERALEPLPFADVTAPTLVAHGANDAFVPVTHATTAAEAIGAAQLMMVDEGHHLLSLSRHYEPVARRQLELVRG
jgi:pimeloyl-ACP methyl ester carboxylesterase